jgi:hypothetical protein
MFEPITSQADKLRQTVFSPDTAATYTQAGSLTWMIVKETGYLLWLVVCVVLVLGEWIWKTAYTTGQTARTWVNNLESKESAPSVGMDQVLSDTGKKIWEVSKSSALKALSTAKDQLGVANEPVAPPAPKPPAPPVAPPAVSAPAPSASATPSATPEE